MFISIIIPVYNDLTGLCDTVDSLLAQDFAESDFEIIVCDNGSSDGTWQRAVEYHQEFPHRVIAVQEASIQSSYAARNRGLKKARGEVICFVDADMMAPPHYLHHVRKRFSDTDVDYLACDVRIVPDHSTLSSVYNCVTGFPVERYLERGHYAPTCCLCIRRSVLDEVGTFDERLESGGDMEFGQRVFDAGLNQAFAEEIILNHPPRKTFKSLLNKHRRIARGHAQLSYHYPKRYSLFSKLYLRTTRYFHPTNPLRLMSTCRKREISVRAGTLAALTVFHIPLVWAGALSYVGEARRLRDQSSKS